MKIKYRRAFIRIITLAIALTAVSIGLFIREMYRKQEYKQTLDYTYESSLAAMVDHVANIEASMMKAQYTNSPSQLVALSSMVWRESGAAIAELARLPLSEQNLGTLTRFLSQTGDYVFYLAQKVVKSEDVTTDERETLKKLGDYSRQVADHLIVLQSEHSQGQLTLAAANVGGGDIPSLADGLVRIQEGFDAFPMLIYDGPFSDHIEKRESVYLKDMPEVTADEARAAAALYAGLNEGVLESAGEGAGVIPAYSFVSGGVTVDISRRGGLLLGLIDSRTIGQASIPAQDAVAIAQGYLDRHGFTDMTYSYYAELGGIVTVNFAYTQDDVVVYPDLIKVGVALDDGSVVSADAAGYMMSHLPARELPEPALTSEEAQALLASTLAPEVQRMAVIPTDGGGETYCFEFLCRARDGRDCLVYINALTGLEERILLLLKSDGGTLTM